MGGSVALEVILILVLVLANGLLAMAEIAIVAARKARLEQEAKEGDDRARAALELAEHPSDFLSTVQIGITLVGILAGVFGGATIAEQLADLFARVPWLQNYSEALAIAVVVIIITYFTLVLGELAPKRLALNNPERVARWVAQPMRQLSRVGAPFVRILSRSTDLVLRIIGMRPSSEPSITEDEIRLYIDQGAQAGVLVEAEQEMMESVLRLGDRRVDVLMTPRTDIVWLDLEDLPEVNRQKIIESPYSRLPVAWGNLDHVVGIVRVRDLMSAVMQGQPCDIQSAMVEPLYLPENVTVLIALDFFRKSQEHLALVIDEFGGVQGLLTVFDILEAIVGDIPTAGFLEPPGVVAREDGSWFVDGMLPIDELKNLLKISYLPGEERGGFQTLGGFMMTYLGKIPRATDSFVWQGYAFEVLDMDGLRVDKVHVRPVLENLGGASGQQDQVHTDPSE